MAVPKRKTSKSRRQQRRSHHQLKQINHRNSQNYYFEKKESKTLTIDIIKRSIPIIINKIACSYCCQNS